jgi:uncharacterized protein YkwD
VPEELAENFVQGWRDSPTHRANLLNRQVAETGIGVASSASNEYYAVHLVALPLARGTRKGEACPR